MPFSVRAQLNDLVMRVYFYSPALRMRKIDDILKLHLLLEGESQNLSMWLSPSIHGHCHTAYPAVQPPRTPERPHCKPTATESIDNHSGILICPLNILFAKTGPWRGVSPKSTPALLNQPRIT